MSKQLNVILPEQINKRLEDTSQQTGLSKSEIVRRGALSQVKELEGENK